MTYTCNTEGCPKQGVVYQDPAGDINVSYIDGSHFIECTRCGSGCLMVGDPEPTPEPEIATQDEDDLSSHMEELSHDNSVGYHLNGLYDCILNSATFHQEQVRIIMRELVDRYLLERELNG